MKTKNSPHYLWYGYGISKVFWEQVVRPCILKKYDYRCSKCGSSRFIDIHHTDYENQNINTLITLCRSCHLVVTNNGK